MNTLLRTIAIASLLLFLSVPASGMKGELFPVANGPLSTASALLRSRDYAAAAQRAKDAPDGGVRDFIAGLAFFKAEEWENASRYLAAAETNFETLADYALYFQARSLVSLKRFDEALPPLATLGKLYPNSPLKRRASQLSADIHFELHNHQAALAAYLKFIESYPTGSDSLTAQYRIALCREALGEPAAAARILRNLWLTSPSSPVAADAEEQLKRISAAGIPVEPYTSDELLKRACTLLDLRRFAQSVASFRTVPREGQTRDFIERLDLKYGQALYRSRNNRDAENLFAKLAAGAKDPGRAAEATYWLARSMDRNGKDEEAFAAFLQVAEKWPKAHESDNALLEAAYIRKSGQRWSDVTALVRRLLSEYPDSPLKKQALWEGGWSAYKSGDLKTAAEFFERVAGSDAGRDRALYWLARVKADSGDSPSALSTYATLLTEYPLSYYALASPPVGNPTEATPPENNRLPKIDQNTLDSLPLPANHDRIKALITFGLYEEARRELSGTKVKSGELAKLLGIARLYLEMDDYNGAYNLGRRESQKFGPKDRSHALALQYPLPFRETAQRHASSNNLPLALVTAVIRAESSFSPSALSPAGAVGLMQLMPSTAALLEGAGRKSVPQERLSQPELNISYGSRHMSDLLRQYDNNLVAVIASYNAGGGTVNRWLRNFGSLPADEFVEQIPYGETRDYVKQVLASTAIYSRLYGLPVAPLKLPLPPQPSPPAEIAQPALTRN